MLKHYARRVGHLKDSAIHSVLNLAYEADRLLRSIDQHLKPTLP